MYKSESGEGCWNRLTRLYLKTIVTDKRIFTNDIKEPINKNAELSRNIDAKKNIPNF